MSLVDDKQVLPPPAPLVISVQPATVHRGPPEAYKNSSEPRGAVFIANYRDFDDKGCEIREGSEHDVANLRELFSQMGYENIGNLDSASKEETLDALKRFRDDKIHWEVDSLVVIFMSHGYDKESFFTRDGEILSYEEVYSMFNNLKCPALVGKLKIFIFQFCRGKQEHISVSNSETDAVPIDAQRRPKKRGERQVSDVFVCFSALPGFASYRHPGHGSHYIHSICRVFMEKAKDIQFDGLMRKANKALPDAVVGEVRDLGTREAFFFNPPASQSQPAGERAANLEVCPVGLPYAQGTEDAYKNSSDPRGLCLIVNNLPGCEEDVTKLSDLFTLQGYQVLPPFSNLTQVRLIEELESFKQKDQGDSAIVIFYGNGFEDCLVSSDGKILTFDQLTERFNDIQCPNLAGKPKIFILNTCYYTGPTSDQDQGLSLEATRSGYSAVSQDCSGWSTDGDTIVAGWDGKLEIPAERDMVLFSVEADEGSCDRGSLLTEALYQILTSGDISLEISSLLRRVCRRLDELQNLKEKEYFPDVRSIKFRRDFYFSPPKTIKPDTPGTHVLPAVPRELRRSASYPSRRVNVKEVKQPVARESYVNWSNPHGLAIIVYYNKYESEELVDAPWRKTDACMLSELLMKLGYKTELHSNISYREMKGLLQEFRDREEHFKVDSMIFVVLGLASDQNTLYTTSSASLPLDDVYQYFTDNACPALKDKPKIFFFHMTQLHDWRGAPPASPRKEDLNDVFVLRLISKIGPEKGVHPSKGLWALREALEHHAHDTHLESIVGKVEGGVDASERFSRQYGNFRKKFYFNPKRAKN